MCWWSPTCVCSSSNYIVPPATSLTTEMVMNPLFSNLLSSAHCSTERSNICSSTFNHNIFKMIMFRKELIIQIPYSYEFVIPHSIQIRQISKWGMRRYLCRCINTHCAQGCALYSVERTQGWEVVDKISRDLQLQRWLPTLLLRDKCNEKSYWVRD